MELPGDLRCRAGFIREARGILELQGQATGELLTPAVVSNNFYMLASSIQFELPGLKPAQPTPHEPSRTIIDVTPQIEERGE
jgi:hypothetical protein